MWVRIVIRLSFEPEVENWRLTRRDLLHQVEKQEQSLYIFLFSVANYAVYKSNVFANELTFHKACLVVIDKIGQKRFQTIGDCLSRYFVITVKKS